jgi:hypothetical protein
MQPGTEDMQLCLTSKRLGLLCITPLVDPANVRIVHDHNGRVPRDACKELLLALAVSIRQLSDVKNLPVSSPEPLSHAFKVVISADDRSAGELVPSIGGLSRTSATNQEDHSRSHEVLSDPVDKNAA